MFQKLTNESIPTTIEPNLTEQQKQKLYIKTISNFMNSFKQKII